LAASSCSRREAPRLPVAPVRRTEGLEVILTKKGDFDGIVDVDVTDPVGDVDTEAIVDCDVDTEYILLSLLRVYLYIRIEFPCIYISPVSPPSQLITNTNI
jgi:hypothetical protein